MIRKILINGKYYDIDGKSAYEVAVENGYEGTVEDWLNSLKGKTPQKGTDYFTEEDIKKIVEEVNISTKAKIGYVTLLADNWKGANSPYSQVVTVEGSTKNSQVDLTPNDAQLDIFHEKDLAFVTSNYKGVVTVSAIGQKPQNDYNMQVTITEVENTDDKTPIIGVTVGTPKNPSVIEKKVSLLEKTSPLIPQIGKKNEFNQTVYNIEIGKEYKAVYSKEQSGEGKVKIRSDAQAEGYILISIPAPDDGSLNDCTFKVLGNEGSVVSYEYCGKVYTADIPIFELFEIGDIWLENWSGDLYLCNPDYITELVLNSLPKAGDWVL